MADPLRESAVQAVVVTSGPASRAGGRGTERGHYLGRRVSKHTIESERRNARAREQGRKGESRRTGEKEKERKGKDAVEGTRKR